MKNVFDWYQSLDSQNKQKPWLILGKGPSYDKKAQFDVSAFNTLSLNHVVRDAPVFLAHMIDIDVVESCADCLLDNAAFFNLALGSSR